MAEDNAHSWYMCHRVTKDETNNFNIEVTIPQIVYDSDVRSIPKTVITFNKYMRSTDSFNLVPKHITTSCRSLLV